MKTKDIINRNIEKYCRLCNISYNELSIKLGKKEVFIEKLLNGEYKKQPTIDLVDSIAVVFNVDVEKLLERE